MSASGSIVVATNSSPRLHHAARDLQRYLSLSTRQFVSIDPADRLSKGGIQFVIACRGDESVGDALIQDGRVPAPEDAEGYALRRDDDVIAVVGADEPGAVYGVYALLEEAYGCGFFLGSEVVPGGDRPLMPESLDVQRAPAFSTRGLLPWYDFLSGPTAWNLADYRLYIDRMVRMGLNFLGLHVYSTGTVTQSGGAEPFLSFTYRGVGHDAYLDTTQTSRWGYLPVRISDFSFGTEQYFAGEVFGADAAVMATDPLDAVDPAKALLSEALDYAKARGLKICVGFEPAAVPQEILDSLPPSAKQVRRGWKGRDIEILDLTSVAAREILHVRLDDLHDTYPQVDAIWLWQNEDAAWTTQRANVEILPFDASYLEEARRYLQERAPHVRVVVSGWGAVHALFDQLHEQLPKDMPFSALHHNLGTTETDEVYGRVDDRQRWPIPWLEDDATLWHPQFYVDRFRNDIERAARFGADGMIGIHWRTRVIDHNASYFARALWDPGLDTGQFYRWYADRLVGQGDGSALASQFEHIDRTNAWPGYLSDDHVGSVEWSHGHSNEAGAAFNPLPTPEDVLPEFDTYLAELQRMVAGADASAAERLRYHAAQAEFARHYVVSQHEAARIDHLAQVAKSGNRKLTEEELSEASARLETLYNAVRDAIECFAAVQTTTADLGVLASLNQKYVTRAMWQRCDAVREMASDPSAVPQPNLERSDHVATRLFVPVPPEMIPASGAEVRAIVSGSGIASVDLCAQPLSGGNTERTPLRNTDRGVWVGSLQTSHPVRYWIEAAKGAGGSLRAPESSEQFFSAIVGGTE